MSLINDQYRILKIKSDALPYLDINDVIIWHEDNICLFSSHFTEIVWAKILLFCEFVKIFYVYWSPGYIFSVRIMYGRSFRIVVLTLSFMFLKHVMHLWVWFVMTLTFCTRYVQNLSCKPHCVSIKLFQISDIIIDTQNISGCHQNHSWVIST